MMVVAGGYSRLAAEGIVIGLLALGCVLEQSVESGNVNA